MAGEVPSTLNQYVKFEWDYQEVMVHEELSHPIYSEHLIPIIEEIEKFDGATFHGTGEIRRSQ